MNERVILVVRNDELNTVRIAIIGFGNLGRSLAQMLIKKKPLIKAKFALNILVSAIVDVDYSIVEKSDNGINLEEILSLKKIELINRNSKLSFEEILKQVPLDMVVELTPSNPDAQPGLDHIRNSLKAKKHVVTSNKSPLVLNSRELLQLAQKEGCQFRFEATVGGVIPIFTLVQDGFSANEIIKIEGILNGTTNYILTQMSEGSSYPNAIEHAKKLGFCETNPYDDVSGLDAARKLVIIANVLLNANLTLEEVEIKGIEEIKQSQIIDSHLHNQVIKHIASLDMTKSGIQARVQPQSIPLTNPLAHINGIINAIHIFTKYAGEITISGVGAGPQEVGTIILSDIITVGRKIRNLIPIEVELKSKIA